MQVTITIRMAIAAVSVVSLFISLYSSEYDASCPLRVVVLSLMPVSHHPELCQEALALFCVLQSYVLDVIDLVPF